MHGSWSLLIDAARWLMPCDRRDVREMWCLVVQSEKNPR